MEAATAQSKPPVETRQPEKGDPLFGYWPYMSHLQRQRWHELTDKYARRRRDLDEKQAAARGTTARTRYPSVHGQQRDRDIDAHVKINQAEDTEKRSLLAEVQTEMNRRQRERDQGDRRPQPPAYY